jgi:putative resolvase
MDKELLSPKEAGKLLGVSTRTIQRWDKQGLIKTVRTPKGRRRIPLSEVKRLLRQMTNDKRAVIYARVSSRKQDKDGNLERQIERLLKWAKENNYEVVKVFKDTASGINDKRKNFWKMMEFIKQERIPYLIVEFHDRLTRFGFEYIKALLKEYGTELIIVEKKMDKDKMEELVEDLITIITSFTARIYGARSQKFKKVKEILQDEDNQENSSS